jgi:hypothetical protein
MDFFYEVFYSFELLIQSLDFLMYNFNTIIYIDKVYK